MRTNQLRNKIVVCLLAIITLITFFSLPFLLHRNFVKALDLEVHSPTFSTAVSGTISENTVWKVADSPYVITGNVILDANATLTLEPGVVVKFAGYYHLMVRGTLNALGTPLNPIIFTSNASLPSVGSWNGVQSSGFRSVMNFNHTKIEYASTGIYNNNGNITVANSELSLNNVGIYFFQHSHSNITYGKINDNTIKSNSIGFQIDIRYGPVGNITLENNIVTFNNEGITLDFFNKEGFNVSITRNLVSLNNSTGVKIEGGVPSASLINITQNYITFNNAQGIYLNLWKKEARDIFLIEDNDIHSNGVSDFKVGGQYITNIDYTINASSNYWGTSDTMLIDESIYDFYDDHRLGKVGYVPILNAPLESRYPDAAIDHEEPTVSVSSPLNNTYTDSSNVSITWNGDDAGSGIDHYAVKLDDNPELSVGINSNHIFENVSEGFHTIHIFAYDRDGNIREALISIGVDVTPPMISDISIVNGSVIKSTRLNLTWSGSDAGSRIDHYEIKCDNDVWINLGVQTNYTLTYLRDGSHTIIIKALDKANNFNETTMILVVNTSLLLGPGWIDDALFFGGAIGLVVVISVYYFFGRRKNTQISKDVSIASS